MLRRGGESMGNAEQKCEQCGEVFKTTQALMSHVRNKHPEVQTERTGASIMKAQPIEALIRETRLPEIVNGKAEVFDAGVEYGMRSILIGVRVAQELSKMGIDQASPIIKMAQEMRQTEGQVAKETGIAMGAEMAGRMFDFLEQRLPQKADIAMAPDPMRGLMARNMETMFNRLLGMVGGGPPGPTPGLVDKRTQK